jgi:hypothetical protein
MTKQTTPHTQSQQNVNPNQSDLELDQLEETSGTENDAEMYRNMDGAETGTNRAPHKFADPSGHRSIEPATTAYEGPLSTRTPKGPGQGITSRSSDEESTRQEKVVKDRPDAQAGVNHSI